MSISAPPQEPRLDADSASLRAWFLLLVRSLVDLLGVDGFGETLRRSLRPAMIVLENWVATLVFELAAQRFTPRGRPVRLGPANAPPGFRPTHTFTGLMRRYRRADHRGTLDARARRLVVILTRIEDAIRRVLRRLERGPHGAGLVLASSPADALPWRAPAPAAHADTS